MKADGGRRRRRRRWRRRRLAEVRERGKERREGVEVVGYERRDERSER